MTEPTKPPSPHPRIETDGENAVIWMEHRRVAALENGVHSMIYTIHQHMLEKHGKQDANVYLTGVIHGLREAVSADIGKTVREIQARRLGDQDRINAIKSAASLI